VTKPINTKEVLARGLHLRTARIRKQRYDNKHNQLT
jgi:hypothetical protein